MNYVADLAKTKAECAERDALLEHYINTRSVDGALLRAIAAEKIEKNTANPAVAIAARQRKERLLRLAELIEKHGSYFGVSNPHYGK